MLQYHIRGPFSTILTKGRASDMNFRRWILPGLDKEAAASLAEEAGLEPFLALMLSPDLEFAKFDIASLVK